MKFSKKCEYCGEPFMAFRISTRYCNPNCNKAHYKILSRKRVAKRSISIKINKKFTSIDEINKKLFLSIDETCKLLGLSRSTINRYIKSDKLKTLKLNKRVIIKRESIDSFLTVFEAETIPNEVINTKKSFNIKNYYYFGEVQNLYGISESTINIHLRNNKIEKTKIGKYYYILKRDIVNIFGNPKTPKKDG